MIDSHQSFERRHAPRTGCYSVKQIQGKYPSFEQCFRIQVSSQFMRQLLPGVICQIPFRPEIFVSISVNSSFFTVIEMQSISCSHPFWIFSGGWLFLSPNEKKIVRLPNNLHACHILWAQKRRTNDSCSKVTACARTFDRTLKTDSKRYLFWSKCKQGSGVCIFFFS